MDFTCSEEVFKYFESFTNLERSMSFSEREYRLDRMHYLLELFKNPQNEFKIIHVAGSKGKGSTAAAISSILTSLGYKTGLYTSPHLITYKERITHSGVFIEEQALVRTGKIIRNIINNTDIPFPDPPTTFELLTCYAFIVFRETGCEWAVIETGIGGRLDATNVAVPEASVITPIEMEHADILGDTLEKIASEKCGIIKQKKPVFVSPQKMKALNVIKQSCFDKSSALYLLDDYIQTENIKVNKNQTVYSFTADNKKYKADINLTGVFQAYNSALAILTVKKILNISWEKTVSSLKNIPLNGRIEIISRDSNSDIIIDSSHTPDSASVFADTLEKIYPDKGVVIFGSVDGKDHIQMIKNISRCFENIIISKPGSFKKNNPENVFKDLKRIFPEKNIILETDTEKALLKAEKFSGGIKQIAVTGSFYMASEIKKLLGVF